jgi:hypothetical protein
MAHAFRGWWLCGLGFIVACQPGRLEECDGRTTSACAALFGAGGKDAAVADAQQPVTPVSAATAVTGCAMHATVGEVETGLFAARCGTRYCHTPGSTFKPDLASPETWRRLVDMPTQYRLTRCKDDSYIATSAPLASYFLSVVRDAQPTCADGRAGGPPMPFVLPALSADEIACVEGYVKAVAGAP